MNIVAGILVALVAALHLYFLVLEMFLWTRPLGIKTFGNTIPTIFVGGDFANIAGNSRPHLARFVGTTLSTFNPAQRRRSKSRVRIACNSAMRTSRWIGPSNAPFGYRHATERWSAPFPSLCKASI